MNKTQKGELKPIGWREWVTFPEWNVDFIKAKVDTGARTSSLHVENLKEYEKDGQRRVRFDVAPWQKNSNDLVQIDAQLQENRNVRSSSGEQENRPVILTRINIEGEEFPIELTLTNRNQMGFRMLLGREALKNRYYVIAGKSYLGGKPPREIIKKNRGNK